MTKTTTDSLGTVHAGRCTASHLSMVSAEMSRLRIILPCGIVRADLAFCQSGAVGASLEHLAHRGTFTCRYEEHDDLFRANWES